MTERPRFSRLKTFASNLNSAMHPTSRRPPPILHKLINEN
jgi:hypothetical protein